MKLWCRGLVVASLLLVLPGCFPLEPAATPPRSMAYAQCSEEAFTPYRASGSGTLRGQAFLRTRGGEVRYASGEPVILIPAVDCAVTWWQSTGLNWQGRVNFPTAGAFVSSIKNATADAQGNFVFSSLAPGRYYVRTQVTWYVGNSMQGGLVGAEVEVTDGGETQTILTWR